MGMIANILEAADAARWENLRAAVKAAQVAETKGDQAGHAFHGNRYTGGIGGGEHSTTPRLHDIKPTPDGFGIGGLDVATIKGFDALAHDALDRVHNPILPGAPAPSMDVGSRVKSSVVQTLALKTGLSYDRANAMIRTWARTSSDTSPDSVALQMAAAQKFGVGAGDYLEKQAVYMARGYRESLDATLPPPRNDVDASGAFMTQTEMERNQAEAWITQMKALNDAVKVSLDLDKQTSFVIPKGYAVEEIVNHGYGDYPSRPYPGFGTNIYTPSEGFRQEKLASGDIRFTRDNTLASALPGGTSYGQPAPVDEQPISWDQRMSDAEKAVAAVYEHTQAELASRAVNEMTIFRGMNWYGEAKIPDQFATPAPGSLGGQMVTKGGEYEAEVVLNPLSSFSVNSRSANEFGAGERGVVVSAVVPADRIFCLASTGPGCLHEGEVIVIGGPATMRAGRASGGRSTFPQSEFYG